ncbi:hypothetical protein GCM10020254_16230 [Streptomyces goshikiensis]
MPFAGAGAVEDRDFAEHTLLNAPGRRAFPGGRTGPVPRAYAGRMSEISNGRPLAVFDIDNTLADTDHRQHFLEGRPRDWDGFFGAAPADPPLARGVELAVDSAADCEVVYLTGRRSGAGPTPRMARPARAARGRLWMRGDQDRRPARTTKLEVLKRISRRRQVRMLVDDDELVCQAARAAGFRVVLANWAADAPELKSARGGRGPHLNPVRPEPRMPRAPYAPYALSPVRPAPRSRPAGAGGVSPRLRGGSPP